MNNDHGPFDSGRRRRCLRAGRFALALILVVLLLYVAYKRTQTEDGMDGNTGSLQYLSGAEEWLSRPGNAKDDLSNWTAIDADVNFVDDEHCPQATIMLEGADRVQITGKEYRRLCGREPRDSGIVVLARCVYLEGCSIKVWATKGGSAIWLRVGCLSGNNRLLIHKRPIVCCLNGMPSRVFVDVTIAQ
jgi:hypothetical protein